MESVSKRVMNWGLFCIPIAILHGAGVAQPAQHEFVVEQVLFTDEFDGASLDAAKWTVISGTPQVAGGRLTLTDCEVEMAVGHQDLPLVFELKNANPEILAAGAYVAWNAISETPMSAAASRSDSYHNGTYYVGYGFRLGSSSLEWLSPQSGAPSAADHHIRFDDQGTRFFYNTYYDAENGSPAAQHGTYKIKISAGGGATLSLDSLKVFREAQTNPVARIVSRFATTALDYAPLAIGVDVTNNSSSYGAIRVEEIAQAPTNLNATVLGNRHWEITGMAGLNFSAVISHTFSLAAAGSGIDPSQLTGYKSDDAGQTWSDIGGGVSAVSGDTATFTFPAQTSFSLFAIGVEALAAAGDWTLYE